MIGSFLLLVLLSVLVRVLFEYGKVLRKKWRRRAQWCFICTHCHFEINGTLEETVKGIGERHLQSAHDLYTGL